MKFGVCGDPTLARVAKEAGYDYFEWSVGGLLHPRDDESVFENALAQACAVGLPCPACNVFVPGDLKITGPAVDWPALNTFLSTALRRAERAEIEVIVLGSGAARSIPEGFNRDQAWQQLVEFGRRLGPLASRHGVTIAIEPLNVTETNVLNTVAEGARLAREVDHPNVRLLVDGYHWAKDGDSDAGVLDNADLLVHAHIATVEGRRPPRQGDNCAAFFAVLRQAGYGGRVSIEGNIENPQVELPAALEIMQKVSAG